MHNNSFQNDMYSQFINKLILKQTFHLMIELLFRFARNNVPRRQEQLSLDKQNILKES